MKKYLTLLFLVCAVALTFTGCYNSFESVGLSGDGNHSSGGTDNPGGGSSGSGSIIGTWYSSQSGVSFTFKGDGSLSCTSSVTPSASVPGTYTLDGSKLTVRASHMYGTGTYSGSTISFPSDASGGLFAGLTFTKQ